MSACKEEMKARGDKLIPRSCPTCGIRKCIRRKEAPPTGHSREAFESFISREPHYREFADLDNVLAKHRGEYLDPLVKGAWMAWNQRVEQLPF